MLKLACKLSSVFALGFAFAAFGAGGELQDGRYTGWIKLDAANERIAVVTDFFQESPEDFTQFPSRNAIFKLSLGGYNTHEYFTEVFKDIRYDFDNGDLTLDEPKNDLLITAEVQANGAATLITGKVFVRSSAVWGTLYLKYETDEPEERAGGDEPGDEPGSGGNVETSPFIPMLEGQYEGLCDGERSALQIQTVRGLKTDQGEKTKDSTALGAHYGIVARISGSSPNVCGTLPEGVWCNNFNYPSASFNFYLGKLVLQGDHSSDTCDVRQGEAKCRIKVQGGTRSCALKKNVAPVQTAKFFSRTFHLSATPDQMTELPAAAPPKNADLTAALRGTFSGYLHNESNDTYQIVKLSVVPYSFTNNPHNPNQMAISSTTSAFLGDSSAGSFTTQRFEPRSFYIRPGFTLNGTDTDSFIGIQEWKKGFIRGIWFSHSFGRVGTVELLSGTIPPPPAGLNLIKNFAGQYRGTGTLGGSAKRWIGLVFPAQPNALVGNVIEFTGSLQSIVGITAAQNIDRGTFDPYTGRFGWIYAHGGDETFISAYLDSSDKLKLYWPPSPSVFGALMTNFEFQTFQRLKVP